MDEFKIFKIIIIILGIITVIIVFIYESNRIDEAFKNYTKKFIKENYNGKIDSITFKEGHRGEATIKIKNEWYDFGYYEWKVQENIKIGDSIVKEKGSKKVKLFHKNEKGEWNEKIFN